MLIQNSVIAGIARAENYARPEARQTFAAERKEAADNVTLSQAGRQLSASETSKGSFQDSRILQAARADENLANQLIDGYVNGLDSPLIDISQLDPRTGQGALYAETGLPVTAASEQRFNNQTAALKAEKNALVQTERAKGTPAADILEKIFHLIDQQPEDYKAKIAWDRLSS